VIKVAAIAIIAAHVVGQCPVWAGKRIQQALAGIFLARRIEVTGGKCVVIVR